MTALELVQDTINYYKIHPRATSEGNACVYKGLDDNMCAVGRFINWSKVDNIDYINNDIGSINSVDDNVYNYIKNLFLDNVKDINREVWEDLQFYHDYTLIKSPKIIKNEEKKLIEKYSK